jgi:hypothetical protein
MTDNSLDRNTCYVGIHAYENKSNIMTSTQLNTNNTDVKFPLVMLKRMSNKTISL